MRQIICDDKGCRLELSRHNLVGSGRVNTLRGGGGGLAPKPVSQLIPIEKKALFGGKKKKVIRKRNCVKKNGRKRSVR